MRESPNQNVHSLRPPPLTSRLRPILFLSAHSLYLALVFLFPFLLTYVIKEKSDYARLIVFINLTAALLDAVNLGLGRGLQQLAVQTSVEQAIGALAKPLRAAKKRPGTRAVSPGLQSQIRMTIAVQNGTDARRFWLG